MFDRKIASCSAEGWLNILELLGVAFILVMALLFQFVLKELPCPLCLLQRLGFLMMSIGLLMNLRYGIRPAHYAITLLSGLFTAFVALRQIALHVVPGTGSYGAAIFGLHMYTWSFIVSIAVVIFTIIVFGLDIHYEPCRTKAKRFAFWVHLVFIVVIALTAINVVSILMQCGLAECPENPVRYLTL